MQDGVGSALCGSLPQSGWPRLALLTVAGIGQRKKRLQRLSVSALCVQTLPSRQPKQVLLPSRACARGHHPEPGYWEAID